MEIYNIDPERKDPSPLFRALDYVVNAGLVFGGSDEDRLQSAIDETLYEIFDSGNYYGDFTQSDVKDYVKSHYIP